MKRKALITLGALALGARSAVAAASEAGAGESNLFAGDLGNMVWTLVIFLMVVFVLGKFAWGPLLSNLQDREKFIRDSLEQAKQDREAAEKRLAEYTEKLDEARAEATAIVEEGRRDAEVVKHRIEKEARGEADKLVERAKREIDLAPALGDPGPLCAGRRARDRDRLQGGAARDQGGRPRAADRRGHRRARLGRPQLSATAARSR